MYEAYFGLERRPFAATPDVSCAYLPECVQEVLSELLLRVEAGQGIALLTAPAGTGKTFLCRRLATELAEHYASVFIGSANFPTRRALFQAILYEMGAAYTGLDEQELRLELQSQLKNLAQAGQAVLLILDEAHLLNARLLEEVRSLADLSEAGQPLLRVLVSGQPALEERLTARELDAFNQRLACHVILEPFTRVQSREYAEHRIRWAGGDPAALFTSEALDLVAHGSNGIPRCINQLCDHSLLLTFVSESPQATREIVEDALNDLKQLPLHWNEVLPASGPLDSLQENDNLVEEDLPLIDEPASDTESTSVLSDTPDGEPFSFEIGAEPEAYPLAGPATAENLSKSDPVEVSHAAASPAPEPATLEKEQTLTGFSETSSMPFRTVGAPLNPRWSVTNESSSNATTSDEEWEPVIEEIVPESTTDLGGSDRDLRPLEPSRIGVVPLLDLPRSPFAGFQEESVDDRYASIDAGVRATPGNSLTAPQFNPTAGLPRGIPGLPSIPDAPACISISRESQAMSALAPDELIERIIPLLDAATECSKDVPLVEGSPASIHSSSPADAEPEEIVGGEVLDICLDVQEYYTQEISRSSSDSQPTAEKSGDYEDSSTSFDVIEPDPLSGELPVPSRFAIDPQHISREDQPVSAPIVPRPNYRRIFSLLRRKLGR